MNEPTADRDPFEVIAASFLARYRAGQRPSIEDYAARYPEVAEQIRALLPALVMVEEDLSIDRGSRADTESTLTQPRHFLESLDRSIGSVPRVMLPDTDPEQSDLTTTIPTSDAMPAPVEQGGRYQLFGEIARGGMGAVLKGRDPDLGRDLAVKVLLSSHEDNPEMLRRFVEEAQIGGQLQHPGIVPVYELGAFADRRPYFTMKLVKGHTLSSLLVERQSPAHDLPRFLSIFESICQTVAYSHARGVIHRDLKPSNVMVGSFGEVQVMDWGLAKVLKEGGVALESPTQRAAQEGAVATVRSGSDVDESKAGSVLGTPAYMAPEQASGELERVDRRADVFGLGAILCEILTGQTAYTGRSLQELYGKAMRGDTAEALARLDGCEADAELIALAKDSLAVEPEDRPRDAKVVAERITAYLAGVQERVQAAERERAVAVAKAIEERRRRKVQLALAASVLALTTLGALSTTYYLQQRAEGARQRIEREAASDRVVSRADTLLKEASANPEDLTRWQVALAAVKQAEAARDLGAAPRLLALRTQIQAGLDAAQRDKTLLDRVVAIRAAEADDPDGSITDHDYAEAFRAAEIDFGSLKAAEAGAKIKARPPSVALALATALDDWAAICRTKGVDGRNRLALVEAARVADPDPWRNELRRGLDSFSMWVQYHQEAVQALVKTAKYEELDAISLQLLASVLTNVGDSSRAESVLRTAQQRYPGDVWINHELGRLLENSRPDEAIRFYTAARALRPGIAHELADALEKRRDLDESIAVHRDLNKLRPGDATILGCLGRLLKAKGLPKEASEALEAAELAKREMERLKPTVVASAHLKRVMPLAQQGKYEEVIAELRTVKRLDPSRRAHWPSSNPSFWEGGTLDEAIAEYRYLLGNSLKDRGPLETARAIAAYREAIQLKPEFPKAYSALVLALKAQGKLDEAVATYREAIRLKPDDAVAHLNLGGILRALGDIAGSLAMLQKGHELGSKQPGWPYPSAQWVVEAQRRAAMAQRLAAILKGEAAPKDNAERLALAALCYDTKRFAAASRLTAEALEADPKLGADLQACHRQNAAGFAFLAGVGQGEDDPRPDEAARQRLRAQARGWLRADVELYSKILDTNDYQALYWPFLHLSQSKDLADINAAAALAKFPEPERKEWQSLWAELEALRKIRDAIITQELGNALALDGACAAYREAIRLKPEFAEGHQGLGNALVRQGKLDEASAEYREAIRLKPDFAEAHYGLGNALKGQGKLEDAIAEYREAIRLNPDHAEAHCNLGSVLKVQGKLDEAIAGYREAIRLKPDYAEAHSNLGGILKSRGDDAGALAMYRKWREIKKYAPGLHPSAEIRSQTLDWLKAERDAWSKRIDGGDANARASLVQTLGHWKVDVNMAGVRDPLALATLPEPERKEWQSLWGDVEALLERAEGHPAKAVAAASPMPANAPEPVSSRDAAAVNTLLEDLRQAGKVPLADELTQEIHRGQDLVEIYRKINPQTGHVIVGRVICEDGDDPSRVLAQMPIQSEGYFAGAVDDSHRPVGFRRQGYFPIQITPSGEPGSVEYVGEVRLKRMPETMASAVRGKIVLEGEVQPTPVAARLSLVVPFNFPSYYGAEGYLHYGDAIVSRSVEFAASGLSPSDYSVSISAPGYVGQQRRFRLHPGEKHEEETITLARATQVAISYRVATRPPFTKASPERQTVFGGGRFRANWQDSPQYYHDLEFPQNNGKISFRAGYGPCSIADLGPGKVEDFLVVDPASAKFTDPRNVVPQSGHVYLLDHQNSGKHWVLFQLEFDEKVSQIPGRP